MMRMKIEHNKHIGVYGIIIKEEKIALIKKARGGYKGKLDLPGGGMEHGESAFVTLERELMEEAGVVVKKATLYDIMTNTFKWQMEEDVIEDLHHIGIIYLIDVFENELKKEGDNIDSLGAEWYSIKEINREMLTPFAQLALDKFTKQD